MLKLMRTALNWEDLFLPKSLNDFPDHGLPSEFEERVAEGVKKQNDGSLYSGCASKVLAYTKKEKKPSPIHQLRSYTEVGKARRYINFIRPDYIQVQQSTKCLPRQTPSFLMALISGGGFRPEGGSLNILRS